MTHEEFEKRITHIFKNAMLNIEIVIFGKHKYEWQDEYENFEIILTKDDCGDMIIDWDYNEGQNEYIIDKWEYLSDILYHKHLEIDGNEERGTI